jgi:hypothetical protein
MTFKKKLILFLVLLFTYFCFLHRVSAQNENPLNPVWREAITSFNSGHTNIMALESWVKDCNRQNLDPTQFYPTKAVNELDEAERNLRHAADKLKELRHMIEFPARKQAAFRQ